MDTIDIFYFNSSGVFSKLSTSVTLSLARYILSSTTISCNGVNYAIFAGGGGPNNSGYDTIDVFYFNSSGTFSKLSTSLTLSVACRYLAAATISYNNVDYAIFGGGNNSSSYYNTINVFCVK